ncbi:hypothetical protein VOI54_17150 [Tamlana sp. 2201CG12-4]|uniref:hypothetical protein n=1 Tax=Tamlana sp. 2201CG12-4 TaxID=3112582 RepID=UPI002DB5F886|nr:hypothetical protein [Tamlana sp. 2201CG12-4]MEC3908758.1 hypothetical protein [Tamlana sp. 2201CG12-4]
MSYKSIAICCLSICILMSCGKKASKAKLKTIENIKTPGLELVWETDSVLTTCESVLYDKEAHVIYVSNINNNPWQKDGNGFISTMNTNGEIIRLKWIEGLNAPKGMGISKGKLYVNDIDEIVEIDIKEQHILNRYKVGGNPQLNDITVADNGMVFSSGSGTSIIYKLENGNISEVVKVGEGRLNGLLAQKEGLYFIDSGNHNFGHYDFKDNRIKILTEDIGHGDGIVRLENDDFIVSNWKGEVYYIFAENWTKTKLLDTKDQSVYAADIDYIPETKTLLVPTFFHNRVMAYRVNN